jgi:hypothetical protein
MADDETDRGGGIARRFTRAGSPADPPAQRRRGRPPSAQPAELEREKLLESLRSSAEVREILDALKLVGFSDLELAELTSSSPSTVAKWRTTTKPGPEARTRLDRTRAIVNYLLAQGAAPAGAYGWVIAIDHELDWKSPMALIAAGDFDRVIKRVQEISPQYPIDADEDLPAEDENPSDPSHEVLDPAGT